MTSATDEENLSDPNIPDLTFIAVDPFLSIPGVLDLRWLFSGTTPPNIDAQYLMMRRQHYVRYK